MDTKKDDFQQTAALNANRDLGETEFGRVVLNNKKEGARILNKYEESEFHRENSHKDPLTNLLNRRGIEEQFELVSGNIKRLGEFKSYTIIGFDMVGLKQLNNKIGYSGADEIIKNAANLLRRISRKSDLIGRPGGDEFLYVAFNAHKEGVDRLIKDINTNLPEYVKFCIAHKTFSLSEPFKENEQFVLDGLESIKKDRPLDKTDRVTGDGVVVELD